MGNSSLPIDAGNSFRYVNPGTMFNWREELLDARKAEELDSFFEPLIKFNYNSFIHTKDILLLLQTCPTKFVVFHCLQAVYFSLEATEEKFEKSLEILFKLKNIIHLYSTDIEQFYDVEGFIYLLDSTMDDISKMNAFTNTSKISLETLGQVNIGSIMKTWENLTSNAQSVMLAAKAYFMLLFREPMHKIFIIIRHILSISNDVPEWHYLFCIVQSRKRSECSPCVTKPKKSEMDSLRRALELQPSNLVVWIQMMETLFDWMRTEDRHPQFDILGQHLESVTDIAHFLHEEIQQALTMKSIPVVIALDLNIIASSFYGYKNLPQIKTNIFAKGAGTPEIDKGSSSFGCKVLTKVYAAETANCCLNTALRINPESGRGSMIKAFRLLKKFQRDEALLALQPALQAGSLDESIVLVYIRILVGGDHAQREEAINACNTAVLIAHSHNWTMCGRIQLFFLKGCLLLLKGDLRESVQTWSEGYHLNNKLFLKQFFCWSKTQVRKYMWPDAFTNFTMIETLKVALKELTACVSAQTSREQQISGAISAFLQEINYCFPCSSNISEEICRLGRDWYYLFHENETDSTSGSDSEGSSGDMEMYVNE